MYIFVLLITLKYYSALSTPTMIILLVLASLSSSPKRLLLCFWEQKPAGEDGEGYRYGLSTQILLCLVSKGKH